MKKISRKRKWRSLPETIWFRKFCLPSQWYTGPKDAMLFKAIWRNGFQRRKYREALKAYFHKGA